MHFDTIGNATVICYEDGPILATDPWIRGSAYFGSWKLSHEIPPAQRDAILSAKYLWFSHGHPDHTNADSLAALSGRTILLPDHVGGRIHRDLTEQGMNTQILKDREWVTLSPRIKVMCISDYNQDATLLIDINGRLLVNFNDGNALGSEKFVKNVIRQYKLSFMLRLFSHGDADMIHYFMPDGTRIPPAAAQRRAIGPIMQGYAEMYGCTYAIPFSGFHYYQREDSAWANQYTTPCDAFSEGFKSKTVTLLPSFVTYDCEKDGFFEIDPLETARETLPASSFGDDWSDQLSAEDIQQARDYFHRIEGIHDRIGSIILRVGGRDTSIDLPSKRRPTDRQIMFEVPRFSLMTAIGYQVFDDLLIGNFMKTTLLGDWPAGRLYPYFTPIVAKYADNGTAYSRHDLNEYFRAYRSRAPMDFIVHRLQRSSINTFRNFISPQSKAFDFGKRAYFFIKKAI